MTMHHKPNPDDQSSPEHETSDVSIRAVTWLAAGIAVTVVAVCIGLWLLFSALTANAHRRQRALSPLADTKQSPPSPQLQTAPSLDYQTFRAQEDAQLNSYGWIDRDREIVHIPIERAMDLIAQHESPRSEIRKQKTEESTAPEKMISGANSTLTPRTLAQEVGLDQRLGAQIPLDLEFRDEQGQLLRLRQLFGARPVILSLVYFRCPMLCTQVLNGELRTSQAMSLAIGKDYDIISVSIDPRETPAMAAAKKQQYVARYRREGADKGWHFLTGEQPAIDELARAIGYRYQYDPKSDQFAHPSGIVLLTPDGVVSRYFYGIDYSPGDLRLGLVESSQGHIGTAVDQILLLCFHYDPATGSYGLIIARVIQISGAATVLLLGTFLWSMYRLECRRTRALAAQQRRMSLPTRGQFQT